MRKTIRRPAAIAALALAGGLVSGAATAQETINVSFISGYPVAATWVAAFEQAFVPSVDAALARDGKYKIAWNLAHSGQIVKPRGELEGVETGLGDMTSVPGAFHADKIPLYNLPYVTPFTTTDPVVVAEAFNFLQGEFPEFARDWDGFNQIALSATTNVDDYVVISSFPISQLTDLKGRKVGAAGPNLPWVTPTGAAGVSTNLADAYNSLNTGIYEAMIVWRQAMGAFKLCEPAPNMLAAGLGAASMHILTVNKDVWAGYPDPVKAAFTEAAIEWSALQAKLLIDGAAKGVERCEKEYKTIVTPMPEAERKKWAMGLPPLALDWAALQNGKGYPATAILTKYMDHMRAHNQPLLRQWDKE
jgi:TRAP-type C4-dicarboxylate transport system substrate-binding protein